MRVQVTLGGDILMAKKGQIFQTYTQEFKLNAVRAYFEGSSSYKVVAEREGVRNCSLLKVWVKKWKNGEAFDERDYLKAQVDYLKKRYLVGGWSFVQYDLLLLSK